MLNSLNNSLILSFKLVLLELYKQAYNFQSLSKSVMVIGPNAQFSQICRKINPKIN